MPRTFKSVAVDTDTTRLWPILPLRDLEQLALYELDDTRRSQMEKVIDVRRRRLRTDPRRVGWTKGEARG